MFRYLTDDGSPPNLTGHTVVFPSLGVGNVGQLACDLLISSLRLHKSAIVWHPAIVPIIGAQAFEHDTDPTTTACELYTSRSADDVLLSVVQLRAPLAPAAMDSFFGQLIDHLRNAGVARLIVLTSSYAYEKHLIGSSAFEYLATEAYAQQAAPIFEQRLGCNPFGGDVIFGGGFARRVLQVAAEQGLNAVVLLKFVSEGDNRPDAADMLGKLNEAGCLDGTTVLKDGGNLRLVAPSSWKLLFGNSPPADLY